MCKIEEIYFDEVIAPILQHNTSYLVVLLSLFAALKTARRQFGIPKTHRLCVLMLSVFDDKIKLWIERIDGQLRAPVCF